MSTSFLIYSKEDILQDTTATNGLKFSMRMLLNSSRKVSIKKLLINSKNNILSKGGTEHPMTLYKRFRGHEPSRMLY
jgi:hypothetical protein